MAGMLPGVEAARRRRIHQSRGGGRSDFNPAAHDFTRRPGFCLFATSVEPNFVSSSSMIGGMNNASEDEDLGQVAREAKGRLDGRIRSQKKSQTKGEERYGCIHERMIVTNELQTEAFGSKKKTMKWGIKLGGWKAQFHSNQQRNQTELP